VGFILVTATDVHVAIVPKVIKKTPTLPLTLLDDYVMHRASKTTHQS
jgi:hypothetical protein